VWTNRGIHRCNFFRSHTGKLAGGDQYTQIYIPCPLDGAHNALNGHELTYDTFNAKTATKNATLTPGYFFNMNTYKHTRLKENKQQ